MSFEHISTPGERFTLWPDSDGEKTLAEMTAAEVLQALLEWQEDEVQRL